MNTASSAVIKLVKGQGWFCVAGLQTIGIATKLQQVIIGLINQGLSGAFYGHWTVNSSLYLFNIEEFVSLFNWYYSQRSYQIFKRMNQLGLRLVVVLCELLLPPTGSISFRN